MFRTRGFSSRARGDRVDNGTSVGGRGPNLPLILTLDSKPFRVHQRRTVECIVLPENFSKRLCRSVQFLRIELDSFFQTINPIAAILRATVSRAISARMPLWFNFSRTDSYDLC